MRSLVSLKAVYVIGVKSLVFPRICLTERAIDSSSGKSLESVHCKISVENKGSSQHNLEYFGY